MSGERSERFIALAEQAAQRMTRNLAMIADCYGAPIDPKDDVITFAEMMQHYEDFGHTPGDAGCTDAICERARRMVANALAAMAQPMQGAR